MYLLGVPVGMLVDHRGPRPAVITGAVLLGLGYFPLHQAYDRASGPIPLLCFFNFLTGLGGCMAFAAAVKTSALNWPHHRGTATAFPLAAFGLSAFFFSLFGGILFPGNTSAFLATLATGTFGLTLAGFFFLRIYPHSKYHAVTSTEPRAGSQELYRTSSEEAKHQRRPARGSFSAEPGTSPSASSQGPSSPAHSATDEAGPASATGPRHDEERALFDADSADADEMNETSSLVSSSSSHPGDVFLQNSVDLDRSHRVDIRGLRLFRMVDFWQLFAIMGILTGIGLMTIK